MTRLGQDRLVLVVPKGVQVACSGRHPLAGNRVEFATFDASHGLVHRSLATLGARPHRAATVATALASARRRGCVAAIPRSAASTLWPGERVEPLRVGHRFTLSLVLPRRAHPALVDLAAGLRELFEGEGSR